MSVYSRIGVVLGALVVSHSLSFAQPAVPFTGESEPGVPFPLPQATQLNGRPLEVGGPAALAVSWDGHLLMYWDVDSEGQNDLWVGAPTQTEPRGFVFATFDKSKVQEVNARPDFSNCFGTPFPRFADVKTSIDPANHPGNIYPDYSGGADGYPLIGPVAGGSKIGSMGELGLLQAHVLGNLMYPVPAAELPTAAHGANPFPSSGSGTPEEGGSYLTYHIVVSLMDQPLFWNGAFWAPIGGGNGTRYEQGLYPNGYNLTSGAGMERVGVARIRVTIDLPAGTVEDVAVLEKWEPFAVDYSGGPPATVTPGLSVPTLTSMWLDGFEPTMTLDGHLIVIKGHRNLLEGQNNGGTRLNFLYNETPFGTTGWEGPWELHEMYLLRDTMVAGKTLGERYPMARQPARDYDGSILGDANGDGVLTWQESAEVPFEGGYPWLSHDGRFVIYSVRSGGVGGGHPFGLNNDGGGGNNRAQVSIFGSVTGWQMWRIDHAAVNPSRHFFTAWDQKSRTTRQRTASFGFGPGFWHLLRGAEGVPLRDDGKVRLSLVNTNRLLYYEVDLEAYQQRDYGFYLPMTEMLDLDPGINSASTKRMVDITRTPDLSGNGNFAHVDGGRLPCEEFDLPTKINRGVPGLYQPVRQPEEIHPTWTQADTTPIVGGYWARLADWVEGVDTNGDGIPDTTPHAGRGLKRDMDSDDCWGRVGQAMFFADEAEVYVENDGTAPELNPGTAVSGATDRFTVSLWVHPLQDRSGPTLLFSHNLRVELRPGSSAGGVQQGQIAVQVDGDGVGASAWLESSMSAAPNLEWTHVAASWAATGSGTSELRLYLDGAEVSASPLALAFDRLETSTSDIRIGCLNTCATTTDWSVLLLDEVALKNSTVTTQDLASMALIDLPQTIYNPGSLPSAPLPFDNAEAPVPVSNPYDSDIARLGADLFHDVRLSANQTTSCASCHVPELAFTDGLTTSIGFGGAVLPRNAPSLYNQRFLVGGHFWDARAESLEDQSIQPIFDPLEMGLDWATLETYLEGDADYLAAFDQHMGTAGNIQQVHVRRALATYLRSLTAGDSAVDQYEQGTGGLSDSEKRGRALFFGRARCVGCHNGPNFTDDRLWTTGTFRSDGFDDGAFETTAAEGTAGRAQFLGAFKTPSLRELTHTGPYFHDGSVATLAEVIEFYDRGGVRGDGLGYALLDPVPNSTNPVYHVKGEEINRPLELSTGDKQDLVAFLLALSGTDIDAGPPGFDQPPTVSISSQPIGGGGPYTVELVVDVVDPDGIADLDPTNMAWTLELDLAGTGYDWSDGSVTAITNGYRFSKSFTVLPVGTVRVRAADWHGLWSGWVEL